MLYEQRAPVRLAPSLTELPVSSREWKQGVRKRRLLPDLSPVLPFMCSLVYLHEKKIRKTIIMARFNYHQPKKTEDLMFACVI